MMKKVLFMLAVIFATGHAFGQITSLPATESFDTSFTEGTAVTFIPNWTGNTVAPPSTRIFRDIVDYNSAPAAMSIIPTSSFDSDVQVSLNLTSYQSVAVTFLAKSMLNGAGTRDAVLTMSTSIDGGTTWIGSVIVASLPNANQTSFTTYSYPLPAESNNQSNVLVRFYVTRGSTGTSTAAKMVIDDVTIQQVTSPQVAISQTTLSFTQVLGTPSQSQSFTVSGSNLLGNITLTAPTNFEISLTSDSGFTNTLSLNPTSGNILLTPIYVRFNSNSIGSSSGNLTVGTVSATTQNVVLSGDCVASTVTNPAPLTITESSSFTVLSQWDNTNTAGSAPSNMALWTHTTADPDLNTLFIEDWTCLYNLTSRSRFVGEGVNGISFVNTGNSQFTGICDGSDPTQTTGTTVANGRAGAIVLALNTTAITNNSAITIAWTGRTILKNLRVYGLRMQYRIGTGGGNPNTGWLEFPQTAEYLSGEDNTFETKTTQLPIACNGQATVQIRWVYHFISGTGTRAQIGLDDVSISVATLGNPNFNSENDFTIYPNPSKNGLVYLSKVQDIEIYDLVGKLILSKKDASVIDTTSFTSGIYWVKTAGNSTKKLVIE